MSKLQNFISRLPFSSPEPSDPRRRRLSALARLAGWIILAAALVFATIQFQAKTERYTRQGQQFEARYGKFPPAGTDIPKKSYGAIGRWRRAVQKFWEGRNVYLSFYNADRTGPNVDAQMHWVDQGPGGEVWLHPNMPFVLVLLTPFGYISAQSAALAWNILKILAVLATIWMLSGMFRAGPAGRLTSGGGEAAAAGRQKVPDWIVALALLWAIGPIILDMQHGNTNVFVLGAIVLHLWLYRRGQDVWAGAALALAICLKMTPAIFLLYWLYQRNWKLLGGSAAALTAALVLVPLVACVGIAGGDIWAGAAHWQTLTGTWLNNEIFPGLVKNVAYPVHANQSLSGVMDRYFLTGPDGNIFYNPEDNFYWEQEKFGWITIAPLSPQSVQWIIRIMQAIIVAAMAYAIGWRKLPRDDNRRMLHVGLVVLGMLILNQRTWDHHAAVLLIPAMAIWYAIGWHDGWHGQTRRLGMTMSNTDHAPSRLLRRTSIILMLLAGALLWSTNTEPFIAAALISGRTNEVGVAWHDLWKACGPTFYCCVLMLTAGVILAKRCARTKGAMICEAEGRSNHVHNS